MHSGWVVTPYLVVTRKQRPSERGHGTGRAGTGRAQGRAVERMRIAQGVDREKSGRAQTGLADRAQTGLADGAQTGRADRAQTGLADRAQTRPYDS